MIVVCRYYVFIIIITFYLQASSYFSWCKKVVGSSWSVSKFSNVSSVNFEEDNYYGW
jgi:hypothetical protein